MYERSSVHCTSSRPSLPHICSIRSHIVSSTKQPPQSALSHSERKEGKKEGRKAKGITYRFKSLMHLLTLQSIVNDRMRSRCIDFVLHLARYVHVQAIALHYAVIRRSLGLDHLFVWLFVCAGQGKARQGGCRIGRAVFFPMSDHLGPFPNPIDHVLP